MNRAVEGVLMIGLAGLGLAACTDHPDEGAYHLVFTLDTASSSPSSALPTSVHWPAGAELTLGFDDHGQALIDLLGEHIVVESPSVLHNSPNAPDGTLFMTFGAPFEVTVDDEGACPQTYPTSLGGSFVLYFRDGHVTGSTGDDVACSVPGDIPYARFNFHVTGDRVAE